MISAVRDRKAGKLRSTPYISLLGWDPSVSRVGGRGHRSQLGSATTDHPPGGRSHGAQVAGEVTVLGSFYGNELREEIGSIYRSRTYGLGRAEGGADKRGG